MTNESTTRWLLTPDEFAWVWRETGLDVYPYPVSVRETGGTPEEYTQQQAEIARRYPRHGNPDLTAALRILAEPLWRVTCTGRVHGSSERVRILAAAVHDIGVVLVQKPGPEPTFGGPLDIRVIRSSGIPRHVVAAMPAARPGVLEPMNGYTPRVRGNQPPSTWGLGQDGLPPTEERIRALLRVQRTAEGHLCVELPDDPKPDYSNWIDIKPESRAGGRYMIWVNNDDTYVLPATPRATVDQLMERISMKVRAFDGG